MAFPQNLKETAEFILSNLYRINEKANGINFSEADQGCSAYIYTQQLFFSEVQKIRISDHSVTGNRITSEIHLNSISQAEEWFQSIEKVYFTERFNIEEYDVLINGKVFKAKKYLRK
ncbi:MAG: hypothetical protein M3421_06350 [Bacteroidota bacterium]|nr:hypothetical protein [Bacteroidota bacterium]